MLNRNWNANFRTLKKDLSTLIIFSVQILFHQNIASTSKEKKGGNGLYSFQRVCDEWVNFTSFLARWLGAGLDHHYEDRSCYPCYNISKALDDDLPREVRRKCLLLMAANYIMLAGRTLARDCHDLDEVSNKVDRTNGHAGPKDWSKYQRRIREYSIDLGYEGSESTCFLCNRRS
jgi:hypothetical protein